MSAPQLSERAQEAVKKINQILIEENIMLIPVTTIVNATLSQRIEIVEKPAPEEAAAPELKSDKE